MIYAPKLSQHERDLVKVYLSRHRKKLDLGLWFSGPPHDDVMWYGQCKTETWLETKVKRNRNIFCCFVFRYFTHSFDCWKKYFFFYSNFALSLLSTEEEKNERRLKRLKEINSNSLVRVCLIRSTWNQLETDTENKLKAPASAPFST